MYPKFLIFTLPNVSNKDSLSIRKRLSFAAPSIKTIKNFNTSQKNCQSETFLSKQISATDFYILNRCITSHNKKLLQKLLNTQHKNLSSLSRNCSLHTFASNETIANLTQINYPRKNPIYLKQVYISLSNQIKFKNVKASLPSKRFIVHLSTTLNPKKLKIR